MNREQAFNYLKSSGFSDEQIREIEEGLRPKRIKCSGVNDLREQILIKALGINPDLRWMRKAIDQIITDVFSAACNEDFLYEENIPDEVYRYHFRKIDENLDLIEDDLHAFLMSVNDNDLDVDDLKEITGIHSRNLKRIVKQINVIIRSGLEDIDESKR